MSNPHFDLVILHHSSLQPIETLVRDLLAVMNKQGDPYLEYKLSEALLFEESRTAILENLTREQGEHYQRRFREFLIETELRPTLQLVAKNTQESNSDDAASQYTCPSCGHVQPKAKEGMNTCGNCGLVGEKFAKQQKREEVYLREKRKLQDSQDKDLKEAQERAGYEAEERLRKEARERLGLEKKRRPLDILVGTTVVILMGVAGYFINQTLSTPEAAGAAGSKGKATDSATNTENTETAPGTIDLQSPDTNTALTVVNGTDTQGKQVKLSVNTPGGAKITMSGISDPMDRPTVEGSHLLPGENEPGSAQGKQTQPAQQATATAVVQTGAGAGNIQIAALSTNNQLPAGDNPETLKQELLTQAQSPLDALETLKSALKPAKPERFFTNLSTEEYITYQQKLDRLLTLKKPELAIVYLEPVEDHYATSLMLLKVAQYEAEQHSTANKDDLLNAMKSRRLRSAQTTQEILITANLSQIYDLNGEEKQADALLEEAVNELSSDKTELTTEQQMELMLQMSQDQQTFGNTEDAKKLLQKAQLMIVDLPEDNTFLQTQAFTQLASTSIAEGNFTEAEEWLDKITDPAVREQLLNYLKTLKGRQ